MKVCANPDCNQAFTPTKHNQIYCGKECAKIMTNKKIMDSYYENRDRKRGKRRFCDQCGSKLSRYNESSTCSLCERKQRRGTNGVYIEQITAEWFTKD